MNYDLSVGVFSTENETYTYICLSLSVSPLKAKEEPLSREGLSRRIHQYGLFVCGKLWESFWEKTWENSKKTMFS